MNLSVGQARRRRINHRRPWWSSLKIEDAVDANGELINDPTHKDFWSGDYDTGNYLNQPKALKSGYSSKSKNIQFPDSQAPITANGDPYAKFQNIMGQYRTALAKHRSKYDDPNSLRSKADFAVSKRNYESDARRALNESNWERKRKGLLPRPYSFDNF